MSVFLTRLLSPFPKFTANVSSHQITCELELRTQMASVKKLDLEDSQYKAPYWFPPTGESDPLNVWPHQWYPAVMNPKWAALYDWRQCPGYASGTVGDTGYEDFVLNYTFSRYGHLIPSSAKGHDLCFDDVKAVQLERKRKHFYAALVYIKSYPKKNEMKRVLGVSHFVFTTLIRPTIYILATMVNFLDWQLRLWEFNHVEHFERAVTITVDCFPIQVCASSNRFVRRLTKSGKYKEYVFKGELTTMVATGLPVRYRGLFIGVRHDSRLWKENKNLDMDPREYGIADKAYVGCPELVCEFKKTKKLPNLTSEMKEFNLILQFYRGRGEHSIAEIVQGRDALHTTWRGSYALLSAVTRLTVHMSTLQERMKGPRYDVYGPWPHWSPPEGTGGTTGIKRPAVDELGGGGGGGGVRQRRTGAMMTPLMTTKEMEPLMTTKEMEVAVEATLNEIFAGDRNEVPFDELCTRLIRKEPRAVQAGREAVTEALITMEAANKVMYREGRIHLI